MVPKITWQQDMVQAMLLAFYNNLCNGWVVGLSNKSIFSELKCKQQIGIKRQY